MRWPEGRAVIDRNILLWFHFASTLYPYQFRRNSFRERAEARRNIPFRDHRSQRAATQEECTDRDFSPCTSRRSTRGRTMLPSSADQGSVCRDPEVVLLSDDLPILQPCALIARSSHHRNKTAFDFDCASGRVPPSTSPTRSKATTSYRDLLTSRIGRFRSSPRWKHRPSSLRRPSGFLHDPAPVERVRASVEPVITANQRAPPRRAAQHGRSLKYVAFAGLYQPFQGKAASEAMVSTLAHRGPDGEGIERRCWIRITRTGAGRPRPPPPLADRSYQQPSTNEVHATAR